MQGYFFKMYQKVEKTTEQTENTTGHNYKLILHKTVTKPVNYSTYDASFHVSYTLFQNGRNFSILLFTCKLALVASFNSKYSFDFRL